MHLGNVVRILENRLDHSTTPRVLHDFLVFSQHFPRALLQHIGKRRFELVEITIARKVLPNDQRIDCTWVSLFCFKKLKFTR